MFVRPHALGDLAIRYGYQRFETEIMFVVVAVLIALVSALQSGGRQGRAHAA
jgi:D-methionine transport system permease protein